AFTAEEITAILKAARTIGRPKTKTDAVRRWVPWLLAYTGARAAEITQLRKTDVTCDGIPAIKITPEAGAVKNRQTRTVPLHQHLIEQGFLSFVRANDNGPLFYNEGTAPVPGKDLTHPSKPRSVKAREHLAAWVRKLGVTDREVSPNHGWRHTFKQIAARAGIKDTTIDWIVGHAAKTVGEEYREPTLADKAEALKRFPRYEVTTEETATERVTVAEATRTSATTAEA